QNGTPTRYSYLAEVRYTGNSVLMMQPYYTIRFNYDLREDKNTIYDGGAAMTLNSLIESIEIEGDNGAIWKYDMTYGYDNKHSYLTALELENKSGEKLNSTEFKY